MAVYGLFDGVMFFLYLEFLGYVMVNDDGSLKLLCQYTIGLHLGI